MSNPIDTSFQVELQTVTSADGHTFRIAFKSSNDRYLLPYPKVTGLQFGSTAGAEKYQWRTRSILAGVPLDEFILKPTDSISFELRAYINIECTSERLWTIQLPPGAYDVEYIYAVDATTRRYDYLNRGSRFAEITKPWSGEVRSNIIQFTV
jgi:hypothetical protein